MHSWTHNEPVQVPATAGMVTGVHVHDSIVVLEKDEVHRPVHSRAGKR